MKTITMALAMILVCSMAYAGGSVNKKDKVYGNCIVNSPKVCGGYKSTFTPEEYDAFKKCTQDENLKCYKEYTK